MDYSPKILLIDNQPMMRHGMTYLIEASIADASIMSAESLESALAILKKHTFDLVITEILGSFQDGASIVGMIDSLGPRIKILMYSDFDEEVFAPLFLKAGAMGFLSKRSKWNDTLSAIQTVLAGRKYLSAELQTKLIFGNRSARPDFSLETERSLSKREMTVMQLLLESKSTKEIAYTLNLKENTISTFKQRIFRKLNITSPVQLFYLSGSQFHQPVKASPTHHG